MKHEYPLLGILANGIEQFGFGFDFCNGPVLPRSSLIFDESLHAVLHMFFSLFLLFLLLSIVFAVVIAADSVSVAVLIFFSPIFLMKISLEATPKFVGDGF